MTTLSSRCSARQELQPALEALLDTSRLQCSQESLAPATSSSSSPRQNTLGQPGSGKVMQECGSGRLAGAGPCAGSSKGASSAGADRTWPDGAAGGGPAPCSPEGASPTPAAVAGPALGRPAALLVAFYSRVCAQPSSTARP
jgi:hypothetical protein